MQRGPSVQRHQEISGRYGTCGNSFDGFPPPVGGAEGSRWTMTNSVELLQDVADPIVLLSLLVDGIEDALRSLHRQCWDVDDLTFRRNERGSET